MKNILFLLLTIPIYSQSIPDKQIPAIYRTIIEKRECDTLVTQLIAEKKEMHQIQLKTVASYNIALDSISAVIKEKDKNWQKRLDNAVKIEAVKSDKVKPWGIGVQAGATYDGQTKPYIGVGVSYNLIRF